MIKLTRFFGVASFIAIAVTAYLVAHLSYTATRDGIVHTRQAHNAELATLFAQMAWKDYGKNLARTDIAPDHDWLKEPAYSALLKIIGEHMRSMNVLKVKIYNREGITSFSTDARELGADNSASPELRQALGGKIFNKLVYRDIIYARNERITHRNLISSYVPVYDQANNITGVVEIYSDVTEQLYGMKRLKYRFALEVALMMGALYTLLLLIFRHTNRSISLQVQQQQELQQEIHEYAYIDRLTGLPNRAYFLEILDQTIAQAQRSDHLVALLFLDLDDFKKVNDGLGHQAGDKLLEVVGRRIKTCLREGDMVARLGGDEFTVILNHINNVEETYQIAERIIDTVATPMIINEMEVIVSTSIGITFYPFDDDNSGQLLKNADTAMYQAKKKGRNCYQYYTEEMNRALSARLDMENKIRQAIRLEQFSVHYQPRLDLKHKRITGVEALIRWEHPQDGYISPAQFIPVAEETGLISNIGNWVFQQACEQLLAWKKMGIKNLTMAVNISARQFEQDEILTTLQDAMRHDGLSPKDIEIEITESLLMRDIQNSINMLKQIHNQGFQIALDDFGTGYSSLSYLQKFPLNTLKIDRSFVRDCTENAKDAAMTRAIISLAHTLDLAVVAEGVETEAQRDLLKRQRCDAIQGYLFSKPLPAQELTELLIDYGGVKNVTRLIR